MQLVTIYIMSGLAGIGLGIVTPLIPLLMADSGASGGRVGLAAALMFAGLGAAALAAGPLIDRRGPKSGIIGGAIIYSLALAAFPLVDRYGAFLAVRALEGVGIGVLVVSLEAAINLLTTQARRGRAMGTYSLTFAAGVALGPAMSSMLQLSVAPPFWIAAAVCSASGIFMLATFQNVVPARKHEQLSYNGLLGVLWGPILAVVCYALVEVTMLSLFPLYLTNIGMDSRNVSLLFALYASGAVVSPLIAGALSDRVKREWVMLACGVILLFGTALVWASSTPGWLIIATGLMGMASGGIYPIGLAMIGDRSPAQQLGAANSLFTSAYSTGSIIGPLSVGLIMDSYGINFLFAPLLAVAALFLILALVDGMSVLSPGGMNHKDTKAQRKTAINGS
jgi:MFS family permease